MADIGGSAFEVMTSFTRHMTSSNHVIKPQETFLRATTVLCPLLRKGDCNPPSSLPSLKSLKKPDNIKTELCSFKLKLFSGYKNAILLDSANL